MTRVRELGRYITPEAIRAVLEVYFKSRHPDVRLDEEQGQWCFRLSASLDAEIRQACTPGEPWHGEPGEIVRFTFDGGAAFEDHLSC